MAFGGCELGVKGNEAITQSFLVVLLSVAVLRDQNTFELVLAELGDLLAAMAVEDAEEGLALGQLHLDRDRVLHGPPPALHAARRVAQSQTRVLIGHPCEGVFVGDWFAQMLAHLK